MEMAGRYFGRQAGGSHQLGLPPGFRFHPTDEELVVQYLRRKALGCPLPAAVVPEIDLLRHNPWDLLAGSGEERYFFNFKEAKYMNGSRSNRATAAGYWKATGKEKPVAFARNNQLIGMKRSLVFYRGKPQTGDRTDWIMHEYRLAGAGLGPCRLPPQADNSAQNAAAPATMLPAEGWVLCRVFRKKRAALANAEGGDQPQPEAEPADGNVQFIDFLARADARRGRPASPVSSCVTDISEEQCREEETTSRGIGSA